jgi:hypothetical protein
VETLFTIAWNTHGGPAWTGMLARHAPELVAGIDRNTHNHPTLTARNRVAAGVRH